MNLLIMKYFLVYDKKLLIQSYNEENQFQKKATWYQTFQSRNNL